MGYHPGRRYFSKLITTLDLAVLLDNVYRGASNDDVGFEDAKLTLTQLTTRINKKVWIGNKELESCLWACNMLHERGEFWHPNGLTFEDFLKKVIPEDYEFSPRYNWISKK